MKTFIPFFLLILAFAGSFAGCQSSVEKPAATANVDETDPFRANLIIITPDTIADPPAFEKLLTLLALDQRDTAFKKTFKDPATDFIIRMQFIRQKSGGWMFEAEQTNSTEETAIHTISMSDSAESMIIKAPKYKGAFTLKRRILNVQSRTCINSDGALIPGFDYTVCTGAGMFPGNSKGTAYYPTCSTCEKNQERDYPHAVALNSEMLAFAVYIKSYLNLL